MEMERPDTLTDVEANPRAIFDAHGAESVDELVTAHTEESDADDADAADLGRALDGLEHVSTEPSAAPSRSAPATDARRRDAEEADGQADAAVATEVFAGIGADLEETDDAPERPVPEGVDDEELVTAFEAAADVEAADGEELPETIPFE